MGLIYSLVECIPLFYLLILSYLDLRQDFHLRFFFCPIAEEIHNNRKSIRQEMCRNLGSEDDKCPVFSILDRHEEGLKKRCPGFFEKSVNDPAHDVKAKHFWGIIINGVNAFHQATFFELIAIQFVILGAVTPSNVIGVLSVTTGIILLVFGVGVYSYNLQQGIGLFSNIKLRIIFIIGFLAL